MSPKTGRPKSDNPKSQRLFIRVTPEEKAEIYDFAKKSGYTLLDVALRTSCENLSHNLQKRKSV